MVGFAEKIVMQEQRKPKIDYDKLRIKVLKQTPQGRRELYAEKFALKKEAKALKDEFEAPERKAKRKEEIKTKIKSSFRKKFDKFLSNRLSNKKVFRSQQPGTVVFSSAEPQSKYFKSAFEGEKRNIISWS